MKYIVLILFLSSCAGSKQLPVKTEQFGKITVLEINGQYTDSIGNFVWDGKDPFWYDIKTNKFNIEQNEILISRWIYTKE